VAPLARHFDGTAGHLDDVFFPGRLQHLDTDTAAHLDELLDRRGPLQIGGHQQRMPAPLGEPFGQLAGRRRLAGSLEATEQHHRRATGQLQLVPPFTQQDDQLVANDLYDLLCRCEALENILTKRLLAHPCHKGLDDLEVDIRLQQGQADLPHRRLEDFLRHSPLALETAEDVLQLGCESFEQDPISGFLRREMLAKAACRQGRVVILPAMVRRAKIVATLGPASGSAEILGQLLRAGLDVVRLNLSHGTREDHHRMIELVRRVSAEEDRLVPIIADLMGPRFRLGSLPAEGRMLSDGEQVTLGAPATNPDVPIDDSRLLTHLQPGERVLIDNGLARSGSGRPCAPRCRAAV
jgi:hypothetical protein